MEATKHFIGGDWRTGDGPTLPDVDPSSGEPLAEVTVGTEADVDAAVRAARDALEGAWGSSSGTDRRRLILKLAQLLEEDAQELALLSTRDMGMPIAFSYGEVAYCADYLEYFAGWADKIEGEVIPVRAPAVLDYTLTEPVGVVAGIVPWNAPMSLTMYKLGPALAAGNAIVLKPSELAPLPVLRIVELAARAGFPEGVVNCVTGDGTRTGQTLIEHPGIDKVAFTGGSETGRHVAATCGRHLKRVSLELGGKSANIVFPDADLDSAAVMACTACFLNTGQQCIAGSRLLVHESIHDDFVQMIATAAKGFSVGLPTEPGTQLGPLISEPALERVTSFVEEAKREAQVVIGGERLGGDLARGFFVGPTVVSSVRNDMRIAREEVFGPVLSVIPFREVDEAIAIANDTPYGLAGGVWTNDLHKAHLVAKGVKAGTIWINTWFGVSPSAPFGGYKSSGFGREGGKEALGLYTEKKNVYVQLRQ